MKSFLPPKPSAVSAVHGDFNFEIVPERIHGLQPGIKLKVHHGSTNGSSKAPFVTVIQVDLPGGKEFSVTLTEQPEIVGGTTFLTAEDLRLVVEHLKKYRTAYLNIWNNTSGDIDDLQLAMDQIDRLTQQI